MQTRFVKGATGLVATLLAVSGCGGSGDSGDSGTPNVRPPGAVAPYTTAAPTEEEQASSQPLEPSRSIPTVKPPPLGPERPLVPATQAPPPAPGNLSACKTGQLSTRVIRQLNKSKTGPGIALVAFTNVGSKTCALSGWPTVALTKAGAPVSVPTTKVNRPRSPVAVALRPDRSAFAGLQWRNCPLTATGCRAGDGFRVGAPGSNSAPAELTGFSTAEQKGFPISTIVVGSIQPTTTDIINW